MSPLEVRVQACGQRVVHLVSWVTEDLEDKKEDVMIEVDKATVTLAAGCRSFFGQGREGDSLIGGLGSRAAGDAGVEVDHAWRSHGLAINCGVRGPARMSGRGGSGVTW